MHDSPSRIPSVTIGAMIQSSSLFKLTDLLSRFWCDCSFGIAFNLLLTPAAADDPCEVAPDTPITKLLFAFRS